jgi:hypothetical protein
MTAFITRCLKKVRPDGTARLLRRWWFGVGFSVFWAAGVSVALAAEVAQLRVERADDGLYLSASVNFELPPVVEDALMKGIPMFFVIEADIYRDRWYWTDPRVASAARTVRLAYQPLTRRWRVNIASGLISNSAGLRATLNQNYETLAEAVAAIQRVARWKIAENSEVSTDASHRLEFNFRLDLSQLPRPFQIGMAGQSEWNISAQVRERLRTEAASAPPRTVEGAK